MEEKIEKWLDVVCSRLHGLEFVQIINGPRHYKRESGALGSYREGYAFDRSIEVREKYKPRGKWHVRRYYFDTIWE